MRYVLQEEGNLHIDSRGVICYTAPHPKVLDVSQEIYNTYLVMFWGSNNFESRGTHSIRLLARYDQQPVGLGIMGYIQKIVLPHNLAAQARYVELKKYTGLTHLNIRAVEGHHRIDSVNNSFYPGINVTTAALRLTKIQQAVQDVLKSPVPKSRRPRFAPMKAEVRYLMKTKNVKLTFTAEYDAGTDPNKKKYETVFEIKLVNGGIGGYELVLESDRACGTTS